MTSAAGSVRAFVSYARKDNETYDGVVDRLTLELRGRFEAETGRDLQVFVDRDSIPGGGDWRENIAESIEAATIFIPIVTMRYFASAACREELLAFYDGADRLGVTDLILPVILAGASGISADDPRVEVQIIERLNYRRIDEAVDKGYQSSEWKSAVRVLVEDIARGLSLAEDAIAEREGVATRSPAEALTAKSSQTVDSTQDPAFSDPAEDEDSGDLIDLTETLKGIPPLGQGALDSLTEFSSAVKTSGTSLQRLDTMTAAQQRAVLLRLASEIATPALEASRRSADFEREVRRADRIMRSVFSELDRVGGGIGSSLKQQIVQSLKSSADIGEQLDQLDEIVRMLSALGVMNVSLRKAFGPAIRAINSFRSALSIALSWESLA